MSLKAEDLAVLKKPFEKGIVRTRVISAVPAKDGSGFWVTAQPYVPIDVIEERLDEVDPNWTWEIKSIGIFRGRRSRRREEVEGEEIQQFYVHGVLRVGEISRDGIGVAIDPGMAAGMAFKNAAAKFGIGRYLRISEEHQVRAKVDDATRRKLELDNVTWEEAQIMLSTGVRIRARPEAREEDVVPFDRRPEPQPWHEGLRAVLQARGLTEEWALTQAALMGFNVAYIEELTYDQVNAIMAKMGGKK